MAQNQGNEQITELLVNIGGLQLGTPVSNQKWVDEFFASRRQGLSDRTLESYQDILIQTIGVKLTPEGINEWLTNLKLGNAKATYYRTLKVYVNWLYKSKRIRNNNPITLVDKPKTAKRISQAVTKEQMITLVKEANCFRDACILRLLFDSGIRLSELVAIQDTDFDFDNGLIMVIGKGDKQRKAPFTIATGEMLKEWFSEHKTFELNNYGVQSMLMRLESRTGITCHAHCFRHGFAVNQIKQGRSTKEVQVMGGWSSIYMVELYTRQLTNDDALARYDRG